MRKLFFYALRNDDEVSASYVDTTHELVLLVNKYKKHGWSVYYRLV